MAESGERRVESDIESEEREAKSGERDARHHLKVGFSVPKKKFKRSVHRHRIRRLMAEAWRHNKATLLQALPPHQGMHVFLVFTGTELPTYQQVQAAVSKSIDKLKTIAGTISS
ncbi:hypothetical protein GCM10023093_15500 [Nemorincola caseinilytica]|uniref:Uncharacterized protein n=1 Tax=Nemorincola caseinilytica TaxID=2054315 RepID=A0ABP8NEU0_9BACT